MPHDSTRTGNFHVHLGRPAPPRGRSPGRTRTGALAFFVLALLLAGCATPPPGTPPHPLLSWTFDADLDGWETGVATGEAWGTAEWNSWCGSDRDEGCVKLDGTGDPGNPNAWIYRTLKLPPGATTLRALTTAHDRKGADSLYRVRLVDGSAVEHVLIDWSTSSSSENAYHWFPIEAEIAAFAGKTGTLYFEGADNGPGSNEQRYYDDIAIY